MRIRNFTIGCDPEFSMVMGRLPGHMKKASYGSDFDDDIGWGIAITDYIPHYGCFGTENHNIAEIRPPEHEQPLVVVARIRQCLKLGYDKVPILRKARWLAGGNCGIGPTGGHIHMSCDGIDSLSDNARNNITRALDAYLFYVFNKHCTDQEQRTARDVTHYGKGRQARWGMRKVEYRSLDSWLATPVVAFAVLATAKMVFYGAVQGDLVSSRNKERWPDASNSNSTAFQRLRLLPEISGQFPEDCRVGWEQMLRLERLRIDWYADMKSTWRLSED